MLIVSIVSRVAGGESVGKNGRTMSDETFDRAEYEANYLAQFGTRLDELELRVLRGHPGELSVEEWEAAIARLEARIEARKRGDDPEVNAFEERVKFFLETRWGKSSESE